MTNILILSAGTRDKVVQYFKKELAGRGKVVATDCSPLAPAIYEADEYAIVPRITEEGYLDTILSLCKEKGSATMPLRYNKDKRKNPVFSRVSAFVVAYSIPFPTLIVNEKSVE